MKIPYQIDAFRIALNKSVAELANTFDVEIQFKTMRYESDGSKFSCTMSVNNKELNGMPIEQVEFEKHCHLFDFEKSDYKKEFKLKNDNFILTGFNIRASKNTCRILMISNEKGYTAKESVVKRAIERFVIS